jgi:hypothetical protein
MPADTALVVPLALMFLTLFGGAYSVFATSRMRY